MTESLHEFLEDAYDVDVDAQMALHSNLAVEGAVAVTIDGPQQRFIVDDQDKANWALRKLAKIRAAQAEAENQARVERERIDTWLATQTGRFEQQSWFFESLLEQFHRNQLTADPSKKTIKLPAGTLRARKRPANVSIDDPDAFITWAQEHRPEFVRTKHEIERGAVKTAACKDGEVLPHITVEPGEDTYTVEVTS